MGNDLPGGGSKTPTHAAVLRGGLFFSHFDLCIIGF